MKSTLSGFRVQIFLQGPYVSVQKLKLMLKLGILAIRHSQSGVLNATFFVFSLL